MKSKLINYILLQGMCFHAISRILIMISHRLWFVILDAAYSMALKKNENLESRFKTMLLDCRLYVIANC